MIKKKLLTGDIADANLSLSEKKIIEAGISEPGFNTITEARQVYYQLLTAQIEMSMQNDELRRKAAELEVSRDRYLNFFDFGPVGYLILNEKGIIIEANHSVASMFGVSKESLIKQPFAHYIVHEDQGILRHHFKTRFETSAPKHYPIRIKRNHGHPFRAGVEISTEPDAEGRPGYRVVVSGIPDHQWSEEPVKELEEQIAMNLKNSEERLRLLTEHSREVVWEVDNTGLYTYVSPVSKTVYGFTPEEMVGKMHYYDLYTGVDQEKIRLAALEVLEKKGHFHDFVNKIITSEGKEVWISTKGIPVFDQAGVLTGYRGSDADITERTIMEKELIKAKENAEASDRIKTAFMNNISHEVRTPLNGIIGFGNLLSHQNVTQSEREEYVFLLKTSSDRLLRTITDYIDVSLLAAGSHKPIIREMDIGKFLQNMVKKYDRLCIINHLSLLLKVPEFPHVSILHTDEEFLQKIFHALLDNAFKFTKKGSISIGYIVHPGEIEFFLSDTGIGISSEVLEKIFIPFMQGDHTTTRSYEGSGLGLTIAVGLVRLLGGDIKIESEVGIGTTVIFSLPYETIPDLLTSQAENVPEPNISKAPVILIAEDESISSYFLEIIMKEFSSKTYFAVDGKEAVDRCKAHPEISMVLMDLKMPVMDGYTATKIIRSFRPGLPVIALTAFTSNEDRYKAQDAGFNDFLAKPVSQEDLKRIVKKYG